MMILPFTLPDKLKILVLWCVFCIPVYAFSQSGLSWSPAIPVAAAGFGSSSPRLALLADGTPVAVWGKSGITPQIWCAHWNGTAFSPPVQVNTAAISPGVYDFGGLDVAAFGQQVFIVFENFNQGIFLAHSNDSGASWQPPVTVYATPPGMGTTISAIATNASGNPLVTFLLQTSAETDAHVHLARSTDGGLNFTEFTNASAPAGDNGQACECCYQDILTVGDDTVFIAFRANRNNLRDMWVTRSTDGAGTFMAACDADSQDWVVSACPFSGPRLARLAGDSLLTVWMSKGSGATRVYASTLHGGTMEKGSELGFSGSSGAAVFNQNHPDVAGMRDTVAMIWEESGFSGTGQDLVCAFSTSGAGGLTTNVVAQPEAGTQKLPQLSYSNGIFHLLYVNGTQGLAYRQAEIVAPADAGEVFSKRDRVRIQPNPASDFLNLQTTITIGSVEVITVTGYTILTPPPKQGALNVSNLLPGVYFLKILNVNGEVLDIQKFIKQ